MRKIVGIILIFQLTLFAAGTVNAQSSDKAIISGFVYDAANGEAMPGANIYIKEIKLGASANNSGYFVINDVPPGKQVLQVSYVGYKTKLITLNVNIQQTKPVRIELEPESVKMNEIVVSDSFEKIADKLFVKPVSNFELSGKEINAIPKIIEADLLRALQTMPGITAISDFSSALYVRGGTPDQNLYLIDGTDVYNPEHAFGIFSTFNTNAIKKVDVSKGGFGPEYGGRLSSVIDVTNIDGNRNNFEGEFNLSLLSASTTLQMPIGSIGSISGSFRRTYIDQTYAKWVNKIPDYYFYDGNLKGFFDLTENDKLSLSYFSSKDNLNYILDKNAADSFHFLYNWGNTTGSVNWKHIFNQRLFASFWITGSTFQSNFGFDQLLNLSEINSLSDYALKASLEYYASNELKFKLGAEQKILRFSYKQSWDNGLIDINQSCRMTIAYASIGFSPNILWDIETGARFVYFSTDKDFTDLEPRFSVKYRLTETSSLKFATGIYYQYLNRIQRLFFASIWTSADKNILASSATHFILSYERAVADIFQLEAEVYYKDYKNIYIFNQNIGTTINPGYYDANGHPVYNSTQDIFTRGNGKSTGLELLLRKDIGAISGWLSYSLSRTEYTFDGINRGNEFIPRHDRTSVINLVLNGDLGNLFSGDWNIVPEKKSSKWLFGINFVYATGQPITVPGSAYFASTVPDGINNFPNFNGSIPEFKLYPATIDSYRLPAYSRMDLSITYEHNYGSWTLAPYLQIFNLGARNNIWFINYKDQIHNNVIIQTVEKVNMMPILPSIGVTVKF
jgi:hypothetical protein